MEVWDLYDGERNPLGKTHIRGNKMQPGEFHIVVEVITLNADGRIFMTQRDPVKPLPMLWETTGGSVIAGESSLTGALRELEEETGLLARPEELRFLGQTKGGNYFLDSYVWRCKERIDMNALQLQAGEVHAAQLVNWIEFQQMNRERLIVPSVYQRMEFYFEKLASFSTYAWDGSFRS